MVITAKQSHSLSVTFRPKSFCMNGTRLISSWPNMIGLDSGRCMIWPRMLSCTAITAVFDWSRPRSSVLSNIASSAAWDSSDIVVVGTNDADMAFAVNRIRKLQGGTVVCDNEQILSELPLPVFGINSDLALESIDRKFKDVAKAAKSLGVPFPQPMLSLITLTGAAIPYLRICEEGLVNLKNGTRLPLFIE